LFTDVQCKRNGIVRCAADTVHSGVDLEMHAEQRVAATGGGGFGQRSRSPRGVHDRSEPVRDHRRRRVGTGSDKT
jgi:hypothetical protein